jgi:phosphatidylserine decarboxylase
MEKDKESYKTLPIPDKIDFVTDFLYNNLLGRALLSLLIKPIVSKPAGFILNSPGTKFFIDGFIKQNNIKIDEYENVKYKSFNDFFIRKIKPELRPLPDNKHDLFAPCDGKLTAYPITKDSVFHVKHTRYTVASLLQDKKLAAEFTNGTALIFRLTPDDYHRYVYVDDAEILCRKNIKGVLHTVRPIPQLRYKVFSENAREYELMQTENFGKTVQMEVGALFVGRITNHKAANKIKRGDEKGMFEFGGSTVIMLFQDKSVTLDKTIYENTEQNKETIVKMGCKIGEKACLA